ncbi:MAG: hypothetical protein Q8Q09_15285 [Deltaproteobacteria bacterium]|nr:hypothetical protein [Deltaproteobacteria bacterium]
MVRSSSVFSLVFLLAGCVVEAPADRDVVERDSFVSLGDSGPSCRGNNDGVISRDEVVFLPGAEARYRMNPSGVGVMVNPRGAMGPGGARVWDFTSTQGELHTLRLQLVSGAWFESMFAGAQYAARLDPREPLLGVYRATDTAVELLGVAGETSAQQTQLRYDVPVPLLRFPLAMGATWSATATTVNGQVDGVPVASRDRYDVTVDARGEVQLGVLTFRDALRVRVEVVQMFPAGPGRRRIQFLWMTECYGEVARMTSRDGEVDPDFTVATEFRRLGF